MVQQVTGKTISAAKMLIERTTEPRVQAAESRSYSAEEIQRIIGDPRQCVSVPVTGTLPKAAIFIRKK